MILMQKAKFSYPEFDVLSTLPEGFKTGACVEQAESPWEHDRRLSKEKESSIINPSVKEADGPILRRWAPDT
jgi:hypothetical protein